MLGRVKALDQQQFQQKHSNMIAIPKRKEHFVVSLAGNPMLCGSKVEYAERCTENAFFLGLGDLALIAAERKKSVLVLCYDTEAAAVPGLHSLGSMLNSLSEGCWDPSLDLKADTSDHNTWVVAYVNCGSWARTPFQSLNHMLPLFSQSLCGANWSTLCQTLMAKLDHRVNKLGRLAAIAAEDSDENDECHLSLVEQVSLAESKRVFFKLMMDAGFCACDVPAEGNCFPWSVLALQAGAWINQQLSTNEKMLEVRRDARFFCIACVLYG